LISAAPTYQRALSTSDHHQYNAGISTTDADDKDKNDDSEEKTEVIYFFYNE